MTQEQNIRPTDTPTPSQPKSQIPFYPAGPVEDEFIGREAEGREYIRRIFVFGVLSTGLLFLIMLFMEYERFGLGEPFSNNTLTWNGLFVYSSIVALVLFLCILLFRYLVILYAAYWYTSKHSRLAYDEAFTPPVSIIIPAYNEGVTLNSTVQSLLKMEYPQYEIIIVDDGSTDETNEISANLVGHYGTVEVKLITKPNGGKATALNAGIQVSAYDFILCVDGDSQLSSQTLSRGIRHMRDPEIGAVAGNVKVINRDNLWTNFQALEYIEGLNMPRSAQSAIRLVNIIPGPVGLFRKQAMLDANWYSSDTFAEDADITLKIITEGWRVVYEPDAIAYTEAPRGLMPLLKQRYRWTRGIIQAVRKHRNLFFNPTVNFGATTVLWAMAFESLIWPMMNVFANLFFIIIAIAFGLSYYIVWWWLSLTILDVIAAMYCIAVEKEEVRLVGYSVFYRLFFILIIDICKTFATVEEFLGLKMTWGKLDRIGMYTE